jgi:8-oxo-dGTP diphosphatase
MKHLQVSCAIIERDGFVLATRRSAVMSQPGKWEFPGGKIAAGETPEDCLRREILEELGIRVRLGARLPASTHRYPSLTVTLYPFICSIAAGEIVLHEHAAMNWLPPGELHSLDWAEADVPVVVSYLSGSGIVRPQAPKPPSYSPSSS